MSAARRGWTARRALAGTAAGVAGGLAFGLLMLFPVFTGAASLTGQGVVPALQALLPTDGLIIAWGVHIVNSAIFGLLFSLGVSPRRYMTSVFGGIAWAIALWLVGAMLVLRPLVGEPLVFDQAAVFSLQGHLVFGLVLGFVYVWFHRVLETEATRPPSGAVRGG